MIQTRYVSVAGSHVHDTNPGQLAPGHTLMKAMNEKEAGQYVLEFTHPEFRGKVRDGQRVVVAGNAFGVGSSRENAVSALKGKLNPQCSVS